MLREGQCTCRIASGRARRAARGVRKAAAAPDHRGLQRKEGLSTDMEAEQLVVSMSLIR